MRKIPRRVTTVTICNLIKYSLHSDLSVLIMVPKRTTKHSSITHKAYDFGSNKYYELHSITAVFSEETVADQQLPLLTSSKRIIRIQEVINQQIGILETMTPQVFMDFRTAFCQLQLLTFSLSALRSCLACSEFRVDFDKVFLFPFS